MRPVGEMDLFLTPAGRIMYPGDNLTDVQALREQIPALDGCVYLNCGTFGPVPSQSTNEVVRLLRLIESDGPFNPDVNETVHKVYETARESMSRFVGASSYEIALTRNVSDGINIVATGFDWEPGDEVIITDQEHPSGALPWINLSRRYGIKVRMLPLTHNQDETVASLEDLINPKTKLVFLSHVSTRTGYRLPAKRLCDVSHANGVPIMLDGAHAVGQMAVDVKDLGCDFYAGCGHKWILAPQGSGFLYIDREWIDKLKLTWLGWGMTEEYDLPSLSFEAISEARRFEYATMNWAHFGGLVKSIGVAEELGIENTEARISELATNLKQRLSDIPGIEIESPMEPEISTGLVALSTAGLNHEAPGKWLWDEHRILVAHNAENQWMRLAVAHFLLEEELDRFVECMTELSEDR